MIKYPKFDFSLKVNVPKFLDFFLYITLMACYLFLEKIKKAERKMGKRLELSEEGMYNNITKS